MNQRRFAAGVLLMLAAATAARALVLVQYWQENPFALFPWADGDLYWRRAAEMAAGHWGEDGPFLIAPLYPYAVGLLRWLGGSLAALHLVQLALHLATAALIADAARLRFGEHAGWAACALFLLLSEPALFALRVLSVTLHLFLVTLLWWDAARLARAGEPRPAHAARVGAWLGLFALSFPAALLLVPVAGLLLWLRFRRPAPALLGVAAALLAIAPATLHNAWRSGEWIAISAHGGVTLAQGNGPASIGIYTPLPDVGQRIEEQHADAARAFEGAHGRAGSWGEIDAWFRSRAVDWWLGHPLDAARLLLEKLRWLATARRYDNVATFALEREHGLLARAALLPLAVPWLLGLALLGAGLVWRRGDRGLLELALLALPIVVCLAFYYSARYRLVGVPVACGLAGLALARWRELSLPPAAVAALALLPLPLLVWNAWSGFEDLDFMRADFARELARRHVKAGDASAGADDADRARRHYRRAIQADASQTGAHRRLYNLCVEAGDVGAAAAALETYVAAVPDDASAHLALAWLRATAEDPGLRNGPEAWRHAHVGTGLLGEDRPEGHLVLALAEASQGRFDAAAARLDRALQLAKEHGDETLRADLESLASQLAQERAIHSRPRPLRIASARQAGEARAQRGKAERSPES
ncbi:MAG: tetratricopeptide repeat protein [Myxococcota bacterium]